MRTPIVTEEVVVVFFKKHRVVTGEQLTSHFGITRQALQRKIKEMANIPESEFKEEFRKKEKLMETDIPLKGVSFRAGVILHDDGKRYGFRTNIPKKRISNIQEIAALIPAPVAPGE